MGLHSRHRGNPGRPGKGLDRAGVLNGCSISGRISPKIGRRHVCYDRSILLAREEQEPQGEVPLFWTLPGKLEWCLPRRRTSLWRQIHLPLVRLPT